MKLLIQLIYPYYITNNSGLKIDDKYIIEGERKKKQVKGAKREGRENTSGHDTSLTISAELLA